MAYAPVQPYHDPDPDPDADTPPPTGPLLTRLSDMTFLVWKQACLDADDDPNDYYDPDDCMHGLEWIIHDHVVEPRTLSIAKYALQEAGAELAPWKGTAFPVNEDHGAALVGSE